MDAGSARELVVPVSWMIGIIGTLGGVIATLATIIWATMKDRLRVQDNIIEGLREDINRMSKGCGAISCTWKNR